jgi:hypothetical protein
LLCPDLLCLGFACQSVSVVSGVFLVRVHSFCVCIRTNFAPSVLIDDEMAGWPQS